jgi:polysaccharide biosynthesis protein PslG
MPRTWLALLTCALALVLAAPAGAAGPQLRGVQLHSLWWESSDADMDRELDMAQRAGANVVRVDVSWSSLESGGKGQHSPWYVSKLDRFVREADERGIKVLTTLLASPCWASSAPDSLRQGCADGWWNRAQIHMYPPSNPQHYADAAQWITARYGTKLAALEVWNEPNLEEDRFWIAPDEPRAYAELLKATYSAAKAGDPAVPVLAGALAYGDDAWVRALYANQIVGHYDGLSIHPYQVGNPRAGNWSGLEWARRLQREAGDRAPLWVTEFGWSTCRIGSGWCVKRAGQARAIRAGFAALRREPRVAAGIVYNLRDKGTSSESMEDNFGLVQRDFTPKPGFWALKRALRARPSGARRRLAAPRRSAQG